MSLSEVGPGYVKKSITHLFLSRPLQAPERPISTAEHFYLGNVLRACAERRKVADRKKKEEIEAKQERSEEEHDVYMR